MQISLEESCTEYKESYSCAVLDIFLNNHDQECSNTHQFSCSPVTNREKNFQISVQLLIDPFAAVQQVALMCCCLTIQYSITGFLYTRSLTQPDGVLLPLPHILAEQLFCSANNCLIGQMHQSQAIKIHQEEKLCFNKTPVHPRSPKWCDGC